MLRQMHHFTVWLRFSLPKPLKSINLALNTNVLARQLLLKPLRSVNESSYFPTSNTTEFTNGDCSYRNMILRVETSFKEVPPRDFQSNFPLPSDSFLIGESISGIRR